MKKNFFPIIFLAFTISLVVFSSYNISAAKSGLTLWATSVVPSLFPFFIATELLSKTDIAHSLGKVFNIFMKPLFNIRGEGAFAFIMGIISGYPVGAKIATNFRENNVLSKEECERLLSFTNNSGPLFIIGTVGINMYGNSNIGFLLFIVHILASITVGFIFRFWKKNTSASVLSLPSSQMNSHSKQVSFSNLGQMISESISSATSTIMMIGGFIVLFSVIISILNASQVITIFSNFIIPILNVLNIPSSFSTPIIIGFLEITNGISAISSIDFCYTKISIIFSSFLLGFGGISVFLQVLSITSKSDLSIKPYILGKLLHGVIATFYMFLLLP